jgi:DNA polymerase I
VPPDTEPDAAAGRAGASGRPTGAGAGLDEVLAALAGRARSAVVAVVVVPGGVGLAAAEGSWAVTGEPAALVGAVDEAVAPRWAWWEAAGTAAPLLAGGLVGARGLRACWDAGAAHRLLHGGRRTDPGASWAAVRGLPAPPPPARELDLLDLSDAPDEPVAPDGQLSREWTGPWATSSPERARRWALLLLDVQRRQEAALRALRDPRRRPTGVPLAVLTAWSESAAALLAVELGHGGLPLDRPALTELLHDLVGPEQDEEAARRARDGEVLRHLPAPCDLRNPAAVKDALRLVGVDVPDTRSWRLEPHRPVPAVAALLHWRKVERVATTYGWSWLARHVGADDRLRGEWDAADGGAGRMTASAGLHNLPADLRVAVAAEPGHVLVRADLGQVEPRVLAAVSGDPAFAVAAREDDLYSPVAAALGVDRPTAKVAVLAAMYGQVSGPAGEALKGMDRAYPVAMAYLRAAEQSGRDRRDLRTHGGRLLPLDWDGDPAGRGRYARNAVVQGAAAELFKAWASTVRAGLRPRGGEVVLCLHDELLLHVPRAGADDAARLLHDALAQVASWWAPGSGVRFVADVAVVGRWSEAKG